MAGRDGGKNSPLYKRVSSLPIYLPKPPVPGYAQKEIFSGRLVERERRQHNKPEVKTALISYLQARTREVICKA